MQYRIDYSDQNPSLSLRKRLKARLASAFRPKSQEEPEPTKTPSLQQSDEVSRALAREKYMQSLKIPLRRPCFSGGESVQIGLPLSQQQSRLCRLPVEIRELIYQCVFGSSLIHIEVSAERLFHVTCITWQRNDGWDGHHHRFDRIKGETSNFIEASGDLSDRLLALIVSCRLM